jgi:hypothetical protein
MIYGVASLRGGVNRDSHISVTGRSHYWRFCDSSIRMLLVLVRPPQFADSQQHTPDESKAFKNTHSQWSSAISEAIPKGFERVQHHTTNESEALQVTSQSSAWRMGRTLVAQRLGNGSTLFGTRSQVRVENLKSAAEK